MSDDGVASQMTNLLNEVLRRVGRNLLLFQQIELLMKFLVANANIEVGPAGHTAEQLSRVKAIKKKSLGQVCSQYFKEIFAPSVEDTQSENLTEIRVRSSFRMTSADLDQLSRDQVKFEAMTEERNDLVHHFLERCQLTDRESLDAALPYLDSQRERALALQQDLKRIHDTMLEGRQALAAYLRSPEADAAFNLMHVQSSKIVTLLAQATQKLARPDGWTLLSSAGNFIAAEDPEQLPSIKRRFGHQGLRDLVAAADLFELREEATAGGGGRLLFRIRPGAVEFV